MSTPASDEFDALRTIIKTLEAFGPDDQNRILRWTAEKLGLGQTPIVTLPAGSTAANISPPPPFAPLSSGGAKDIKSFVEQKKPKNDTQFAAVVAYFNRFEATEKKDSITKADLLDACRLANYTRPPAPGQTLRNAVNAGLLDKADRGAFAINSVGENLVAVTLPGGGAASGDTVPRKRARKNGGRNAKKATPKKATAKK
jgi:hypothetical protein